VKSELPVEWKVKGSSRRGRDVTLHGAESFFPARNGSRKNLIKADYAVGAPQTQKLAGWAGKVGGKFPAKSLFYLRILRESVNCVRQNGSRKIDRRRNHKRIR